MNRISSLFSFVGNWLKSIPKVFKLGDDVRPLRIFQNDIDINTGAISSNNRRASNTGEYIPIKNKIKVAIESGYEFSLRCYDTNHTYLTPSPTQSYVRETTVFDISQMPSGTKYLEFVWKNINDTEMGPVGFQALTYNNNYVVADSDDYSLKMLTGDGLKYSIDFAEEESNIKLSTYSCAVTKAITPGTTLTDVTLHGVTGYMTGGATWMFLYIPLCLDERVNNVTVNKLLLNCRTFNEYTSIDRTATSEHKNYITQKDFMRNQNVLRLILHAPSGSNFGTNNSSFAGEITVSMTFSA